MTVNWTDAALADLRAIQAHIATRPAQYAGGVVSRLFARSRELERFPLVGAVVPEFDDAALPELLDHPYRLVCRVVSDDRLDVVAVVHSAWQLPRGL